jgi:hypothetical protein
MCPENAPGIDQHWLLSVNRVAFGCYTTYS